MAGQSDIKKQRLLRMKLSHYKNEECSEDEMHRFATEEHAVQAAKIHLRHGMEAYVIVFTPASFRKTSKELNAKLGDKWVIRDYDLQVEFYFRDISTLSTLAADPEFQAMQDLEGPIVSRLHIEQSIGWVETYIKDGKLVNVTEDGKPTFPKFSELNIAPGAS